MPHQLCHKVLKCLCEFHLKCKCNMLIRYVHVDPDWRLIHQILVDLRHIRVRQRIEKAIIQIFCEVLTHGYDAPSFTILYSSGNQNLFVKITFTSRNLHFTFNDKRNRKFYAEKKIQCHGVCKSLRRHLLNLCLSCTKAFFARWDLFGVPFVGPNLQRLISNLTTIWQNCRKHPSFGYRQYPGVISIFDTPSDILAYF